MKRMRTWAVVGIIGFSGLSFPARAADEQRKADEWMQQLLKRYPEADANKDGVLGRDELDAVRKKVAAASKAPKPTFADVKYGPHERNVLDFWKAESATPTPLVVYIHGGGFVAGDKSSIGGPLVNRAMELGMSVAAIHYRFVDGKEVIFPAPQRDGARAIQFLRSKAADWNIDPRKVAAFGGSAGAGMSMWLGYHDDLADPSSPDPVARQSTRICAIGSMGGQISYDPVWIKEHVGGRAWEHPSILKVYGLRTTDEALKPTPEMQKLYDEASAVTHLTKDDPPIFMIFSEPDIEPPPDSKPGQFIHHPRFAKALMPKLDALGIEYVYRHTADPTGRGDLQAEMLEFFKKQFDKVGRD
ncbi:MAG TPA: alpha/beta hydrolase [Verrucomicrobiae bacterium]|nr:alpha/beta hydrolase [Verrucomicrobiae bacterium]